MANSAARHYHSVLLASVLAYGIWSGIAPTSRFNWLAETLPFWAGISVLVLTYRRFAFSSVSYTVVWVFSLILLTGGHFTYAEAPPGNLLREITGSTRNHFDRLGHTFQGIVPALLARELLLRTSPLRPGKWLFTICISIAVAISGLYEVIEWQYAVVFGGQQAEDFLGHQGDVWDAQKDIACAFVGATGALLVLGRVQDRQLSLPPT